MEVLKLSHAWWNDLNVMMMRGKLPKIVGELLQDIIDQFKEGKAGPVADAASIAALREFAAGGICLAGDYLQIFIVSSLPDLPENEKNSIERTFKLVMLPENCTLKRLTERL